MGNACHEREIMIRIWKDINGYEGQYEISNLGEVKTLTRQVKGKAGLRTLRERLLKLQVDKQGYICVQLSNDCFMKMHKVHRLVATAFIPNPYNKKTVNHKDGNKANNHFQNLEWNTQLENNLHAIKIGLHK